MTGTIEALEHWCADGCGEVIEDKGSVQRVRRWVLRVNGNSQGVAFSSKAKALQFAQEYGIGIDEPDTTSSR